MTKDRKDQRGSRDASELEESQKGLRASIEKAQELLKKSEALIRRHRKGDDGGD